MVLRQLQGTLECREKISRVVQETRCGSIGEGLRQNEVTFTHLDRIEIQLVSDQVDGALHEECTLRTSGAAIWPGGWLIGQHAQTFDLHGRNGIGSGNPMRGVDRRPRGCGQEVGPDVGDHAETHAQYGPISLHRRLHLSGIAAAMVGEEVLPALFDPFDRSSQFHGEITESDILRPGLDLLSEAATDVWGDDAHLAWRSHQEPLHRVFQAMRHLRRGPQRQQVGLGLILRQQATTLHGRRGETWHVVATTNDGISLGECSLHISSPFPDTHRNIAANGFVNRNAALLCSLPRVHDGRQGLIIDLDVVQGIAGEIAVMRHGYRHRLTHIAHLLPSQHRVLRDRNTLQLWCRPRGDVFHFVDEILGCEHLYDTGQTPRRCRVKAAKVGMRVDTAQHDCIQHIRHMQVIDESALACQQPRILEAFD